MIIQNFEELATTDKKKECLEILESGLNAANPENIISKYVTPEKIKIKENKLLNEISKVHENGGKTLSTGWMYNFSKKECEKPLLRTHTTVNTIRYLYNNPSPPSKIFSIGKVFRKETQIDLGPTEYRILNFFIKNPQRVYSRDQLLTNVWADNINVESRTVDVHIRRLRKAINLDGTKELIRTVRSAGYSLD